MSNTAKTPLAERREQRARDVLREIMDLATRHGWRADDTITEWLAHKLKGMQS